MSATASRYLSACLLALSATLSAGSALAHHSFSAEFDVSREVEVTGAVVEIEWTNPHAWVHLDVKNADGATERWAVEFLGVNALVRSGMSPRTVKAGDVLTIKGFGARNGSNTANASSARRADTGESLWSSAREDRD